MKIEHTTFRVLQSHDYAPRMASKIPQLITIYHSCKCKVQNKVHTDEASETRHDKM